MKWLHMLPAIETLHFNDRAAAFKRYSRRADALGDASEYCHVAALDEQHGTRPQSCRKAEIVLRPDLTRQILHTRRVGAPYGSASRLVDPDHRIVTCFAQHLRRVGRGDA